MFTSSILLFLLPLILFAWADEASRPKNNVGKWIYKITNKIDDKHKKKLIINKFISFGTCVSFIFLLWFIYYIFRNNEDILEYFTNSLLRKVLNIGFWSILSVNIIYWIWKYWIILGSKN